MAICASHALVNLAFVYALDPVAMTTPLQFATVGDVRARIGRWWNPDVKAPVRAVCGL